jgi:hypothetical protein
MAIRNVSDGNPDGSTLGQGPTDKISFYGAVPVVQPIATDLATVITALTALGLIRAS